MFAVLSYPGSCRSMSIKVFESVDDSSVPIVGLTGAGAAEAIDTVGC